MTLEHMTICIALKVPFFIVLTKKDICPQQVYDDCKLDIQKKIKVNNIKTIYMKNDDEIHNVS